MKPKICKCGKKALPNRRICYFCDLAKKRAKREERMSRLKARRAVKMEKEVNSYRYLHKKAWKAFSVAVRTNGMDSSGENTCYTCGAKLHWKKMHASHFFHGRLDFSEKNVKCCCPQCNTFKSGNLAPYAVKLAEELGVEGMKQLRLEADTKRYSCQELKEIIKKYEKN